VDSILKGASPSDLPVQRMDDIQLVIGMRSAQRWASPSRRRYSPALMR
jgi:ABC-type uncharacterized transport system substrate-binding protein